MNDKQLDHVLEECIERMDAIKSAVGSGNCTSFEEYKYSCGQIRGLEAACFIITDLKQRLEKSDD